MRKKEPVSIKRQTVYALVPFLDLYVAYKIEKLILYVVIMIGISLGISYALETILPVPYTERITLETFSSWLLSYNNLVSQVITIPIAVYLIRNWSKRWNAKLKTTQA